MFVEIGSLRALRRVRPEGRMDVTEPSTDGRACEAGSFRFHVKQVLRSARGFPSEVGSVRQELFLSLDVCLPEDGGDRRMLRCRKAVTEAGQE